jgi:hypothetical protein
MEGALFHPSDGAKQKTFQAKPISAGYADTAKQTAGT